jgi:hypothetical protein
MTLNLVADQIVKGRIYPALAQWEARPYTQSWREFGSHYPYTVPFRPQEYCEHHGVKINIYQANDDLPSNCYYPIGLGFFDFDIDYFGLIGAALCERIRRGDLRVLFYYHEGDNPARIKHRLDQLVLHHQLPLDCYVFVSANSAADQLPGFVYFADFELWYWQRNHGQPPLAIHSEPRECEFTVLNRLHKSWRATAMADLHRNGMLNCSYWSYCETGALDNNNPIEIDLIDGLKLATEQFLSHAPYVSDELGQTERNNHAVTQSKYHANSYCNIVMETHFDADQSGGTFLTEKTFKPIKHGQMFFVAGPVGSLQALRNLGYRTFDSVLDNSYDRIENNTQRWTRLRASIQQAQHRLKDRFAAAINDIKHNQQLFQQLKTQRLNTLLEKIHEQHC